MYEYFGLIAVLILFSGALFIALRWPIGKHATLSQHVAVNPTKIVFYILLFTVVMTLLLPFFWWWFIPTFEVSGWFGACVAVAAVTQYACTFIPEVGGRKTVWHRQLAGISGFSLLPALVVLLVASDIPGWNKPIVALGLATMLGVIALLIKTKPRGRDFEHSHFLILQFIYYGAFFAPILMIAYS